jgi:hypothetical protein
VNALRLLGATVDARIELVEFNVTPRRVPIGASATLTLTGALADAAAEPAEVVIDHRVHYQGATAPVPQRSSSSPAAASNLLNARSSPDSTGSSTSRSVESASVRIRSTSRSTVRSPVRGSKSSIRSPNRAVEGFKSPHLHEPRIAPANARGRPSA